jgi:hypothetical protein
MACAKFPAPRPIHVSRGHAPAARGVRSGRHGVGPPHKLKSMRSRGLVAPDDEQVSVQAPPPHPLDGQHPHPVRLGKRKPPRQCARPSHAATGCRPADRDAPFCSVIQFSRFRPFPPPGLDPPESILLSPLADVSVCSATIGYSDTREFDEAVGEERDDGGAEISDLLRPGDDRLRHSGPQQCPQVLYPRLHL